VELYRPTPEFPKNVKHASVILNGQEVRIMDANNDAPFDFSAGVSLVVPCKSQSELDDVWKFLSDGGTEVQCGWLADRFGVS
jgi:predicted 3-demethylubiquinone-9 3-methyltransferase (glyoxalase superfamily)